MSARTPGRRGNPAWQKGGPSPNPSGLPAVVQGGSLEHDYPRLDGWTSAMTGIGTAGRDKRLSHQYQGSCLSYQDIARLWEKDGLASKAIEAPSAEAFREGYEIDIGDEGKYDDLKEDLEDKLEELGIDAAIERAWQYKRAYGGGAILLGTDDNGAMHEKLDLDKIKSLDYVEVFEPIELIPESVYGTLRGYGKPEYYRVNSGIEIAEAKVRKTGARKSAHNGSMQGLIHESRLIVFQGIKTSRYLNSTNQISPHWGASVVDRFVDSLRDCGVGYAAAGLLATDVSQPVITIEGLKEMIAKNEKKFRDRMAAFELSRSVARMILLDKNEKFERQTTSLVGIPELLDRLSIYFSAEIDIPLSVLFGYSPSTLGQAGTTERDIWFNKIRAMQSRELSPVLKKVCRILMRSLRKRKLPKKFEIAWNELERMSITQRTEAELTMARTDSMNIKSGMLHPDEARSSRWKGGYSFKTQIDEKQKAPGFMAPIPAGVLPGSTPAVGGKPGAPAAMGPNAHSVGGYARRNPAAPALGANTKEGGDKAPENKRDTAQTHATLATNAELDYQKAMLQKARDRGDDPAVIALLEKLVAISDRDILFAHECGECEAHCPYCAKGDGDGRGKLVQFAGFQVVVESAKGSSREWVDTDGTRGTTRMKYDYGYVQGTRGTDGDSVDVYLGENPDARWVYVIHQQAKSTGFTAFDEDKVMLGFDSANHARDAYLRQYDDERFFGGMSMMTVDDFRLKLFVAAGEKVVNDEAVNNEAAE